MTRSQTGRRTRCSLPGRLAAAVVCFAAAPAGAQITAARVTELVEALESPLFVDRLTAERELAELGGKALDVIEELLAMPEPGGLGLTAEQRARLERSGARLFGEAERAALGVEYREQEDGSIRLSRVLADFPCAGTIETDDFVTHIDGLASEGTGHFQAAILSRLPGESMALTVRRRSGPDADPVTLQLSVEIGRYADLGGQQRVEGGLVRDAYRYRRALADAARAAARPAIGSGISAAQWLQAEGYQDLPRSDAVAEGAPFVRVLPGGQPEGVVSVATLGRADPRAMDRVLGASATLPGRGPFGESGRLDAAVATYRLFAREIGLASATIEVLERSSDPLARRRIVELRRQITELEESLADVAVEVGLPGARPTAGEPAEPPAGP